MKNKLIILALFISVLCNAETYYVSNNGDDNNNGTSTATPWQTVSQVNGTVLSPSDTVLFEANGIWRDELEIRQQGTSGNYITYSRYGSGNNPQILGSEPAITWTETATPNVWQSATLLTNYSNYDLPAQGWDSYQGRIFLIEQDDSISWGEWVDGSYTTLSQDYEYTVTGVSLDENQTYYLYSTSDPDTRYNSIEVTQRDFCASLWDTEVNSYLEFNGIDFKFGRRAGFDAGYPAERGATDLIFRNLNIAYIGAQPSSYAYGLSVYHSNFLVENCTITDCGRRGISLNLYLDLAYPNNRLVSNVIVKNNIFKRGYHTTSLDFSSQLTNADSMWNVYFYNNYIDDSDFNGDLCENCMSNQIFTQAGDSYMDSVYIFSNVFVGANSRNILLEDGHNYYVWNNHILGMDTLRPVGGVFNHVNIWWSMNAVRDINATTYTEYVDFRNNLYFDPTPIGAEYTISGIGQENALTEYTVNDYNLYYQKEPTGANEAVGGWLGYYTTEASGGEPGQIWPDYLSDNPTFDQNSPTPADPQFVDYWANNYSISNTSPARDAGVDLPSVILSDPRSGVTFDMTASDLSGNTYNSPPSIGAYEYVLSEQSPSDTIIYFKNNGQYMIDYRTGAMQIKK